MPSGFLYRELPLQAKDWEAFASYAPAPPSAPGNARYSDPPLHFKLSLGAPVELKAGTPLISISGIPQPLGDMKATFVCILLGTVHNASKGHPQKRRFALVESSGNSFVAKFEDVSMPREPAEFRMLTAQKAEELANNAVKTRAPSTLHSAMHTAKLTLKLRIEAARAGKDPAEDPTKKRKCKTKVSCFA